MRSQNDTHISKLPLLAALKGSLNSLKPTERLIANCIIADPERVVTSSIMEFKSQSGASVGSIVGFCRRLGLDGFVDFKLVLARDLAQSGLPTSNVQHRGTLLEKVFKFHEQNLAQTAQINNQATLERVSQLLAKANRIEFFSIGMSYPVAYTAATKLQLIGFPASTQIDAHLQLIRATQLKSGDLAFGISCSGRTRETVQCLEVAKANGVATICLTNAMKSPITAQSDVCVYATPSEINYFQAPLASRITQLAVIDALFVSLALRRKNKTAALLQRSAEALLKRR